MLTLKKSTLNRMRQHCSHELLEKVFSDYGNDKITIDETNRIADTWDITHYLNDEGLPFVEKCKVILSFDRAFGELILNGEPFAIEAICTKMHGDAHVLYQQMNNVLTAWRHSEMNDVCPFFEFGALEIPKLMPRFVYTKISDNFFQIEKWEKGEYIPTKDIFPSKELCEERVNMLNEEYDERYK